jgi:hypothetical protein
LTCVNAKNDDNAELPKETPESTPLMQPELPPLMRVKNTKTHQEVIQHSRQKEKLKKRKIL